MKWIKYTIKTTTAAEDFISASLAELGINGIEIENNVPLSKEDQADMFIDFPPELPPDDGVSLVSFYLGEDEDYETVLKNVKIILLKIKDITDIGEGTITSSETEDLDWINNWKNFFHSFTIGDILIKPTWEEVKKEDTDKTLIEIDPGISFGTGKHETTQLCIKELERYIEGDELSCIKKDDAGNKKIDVLDVGFGSGILSIVALKLGATYVEGTDLDENCIESGAANMEVNKIDKESYDFYVGNLIDDKELKASLKAKPYDIVVANILADVIIPMAPVIPELMKPGAVFITSGIIDFKENAVKEAIEKVGLEIVSINHQGEWVNITAKKPEV
ncbi:MAG: 50S ribosomal protein L11 methyltransferase [Lachnospiraceae bacterium]|nr:50S ribosomal protein L11 methyltransferase [Lachnospiraceae bacterium]